MQFGTSSQTLFAATALMATFTSTIAANCVVQNNGGVRTYIVTADNVPDISGICGGLWGNLKPYAGCPPSQTSCGANGPGNSLQWKFNSGVGCTSGDVNAVWYQATNINHGSIAC